MSREIFSLYIYMKFFFVVVPFIYDIDEMTKSDEHGQVNVMESNGPNTAYPCHITHGHGIS